MTGLFLSLDNQFSDVDVVLRDVSVPWLRGGTAPHVATVEVPLPATVEPGAYHLLVCADATKRVMEKSETNNCRVSNGTISLGAPPDPPPPGEGSSQALIAADLDAGLIDYGTSLTYRAWALFWDPRLPERYDGTGSTGEDEDLFRAIEAALPTLPAEQQAELGGFLVRPTDPRSPFGPAAAAAPAARRQAAAPEATKCTAPKQWFPGDWPDDATEKGFRAWVCETDLATANDVLDQVLAAGAGIWSEMTKPEPNGMGLPAPDTNAPDINNDGKPDNDGNGKIDVYILDPNQCRDRQGGCEPIQGPRRSGRPVSSKPCNADADTVHDLRAFRRTRAAGTSSSREPRDSATRRPT